MCSWLCAFVIHDVLPHPISHRSFPHQLDTSQLPPASPVTSDLSVLSDPRVPAMIRFFFFAPSFPFISAVSVWGITEGETGNLHGVPRAAGAPPCRPSDRRPSEAPSIRPGPHMASAPFAQLGLFVLHTHSRANSIWRRCSAGRSSGERT